MPTGGTCCDSFFNSYHKLSDFLKSCQQADISIDEGRKLWYLNTEIAVVEAR